MERRMIVSGYQFVKYHSQEWEVLVESGWVTKSVDEEGIATMINEKLFKYF